MASGNPSVEIEEINVDVDLQHDDCMWALVGGGASGPQEESMGDAAMNPLKIRVANLSRFRCHHPPVKLTLAVRMRGSKRQLYILYIN